MSSDTKFNEVNELTVTYGVSVVSLILALALGALSVGNAIALFAKASASLPSLFGVLGGSGTMSATVSGLLAVFAGVVAFLGLKKITTSSAAGELVASKEYNLTNKYAKAFAYITAAAAVVAALGMLLGALLSINDYTPWKEYLVGGALPLVLVALGLGLAGMLIDKFTKAQVKPNMLSTVALVVAGVGLLLAIIGVIVASHVSGGSTYNGAGSNYVKIDTSSFNY